MLGPEAHGVRPNIAPLFHWLRTRKLLDARGYAMAPLRPRVFRRMDATSCASVEAYIDLLAAESDERAALLGELLDSRTSTFGTNAGTWRAVAAHLAGSPSARAALGHRFHAWSVGCATGEEAFTLAMMFAEALGLEVLDRHVEIVATDVDAYALEGARAATYEPARVAPLPASTLSEYFDARNGAFVVKDELRQIVRFERHDVLRDEPPGGMHLVVCRDVVTSFSTSGRRRATSRLVRALFPDGLLVFGRGEWPETDAHLETVDAVRGLYRKAGVAARSGGRDRVSYRPRAPSIARRVRGKGRGEVGQ